MAITGRHTLDTANNEDPRLFETLYATDLVVARLDVFADSGNTGTVYIGFDGTSALSGAESGAPLAAGDSYTFYGVNLKDIRVAAVNDDTVYFNGY